MSWFEGNCPSESGPRACIASPRSSRKPPRSIAAAVKPKGVRAAMLSPGRETKVNKQQIKPFAWGAVVGAVALSIVMFATGWAVTSSTAAADARAMTQAAVTDNLAAICVAQFEETADKKEKLSKLIATNTWQRGSYVQEQGWATMPGSDSATSQVAAACAMRLAKLDG